MQALPAIRLALPGDAERYAAAADRLFRQSYGHDAAHAAVMDDHCAKAYAVARIAAQLSAPNVTALVAVSGADILAFAQILATGGDGEIERFYVDRDWHGRGLAQRLMQDVVGRATALGLTSLRLGVWTRNERAIAFYRRQGFVPAGTVDFLLAGLPQSDLMMQRSL